MRYIFQESLIWEAGNPPDPTRPKKSIKAKNLKSAEKQLPKPSGMGRVWVLLEVVGASKKAVA